MSQFDKTLPGYRFVEIHYGDTLQRIALRTLGDAARWADIANLNDLVSPYITGDPDEVASGVKLYGTMLMVPASSATEVDQTDPDEVFESDCKLHKGLLTSDSGDFSVVYGRANLRQAIEHRIITDEGELVFHPDYRCLVWRLIGTVNGPTAGLLAADYVRDALLRDYRVKEVLDVTAEVSGDTVTVTAEIQPISGRSISVEV
jgi:phage baseplate assembly protein W